MLGKLGWNIVLHYKFCPHYNPLLKIHLIGWQSWGWLTVSKWREGVSKLLLGPQKTLVMRVRMVGMETEHNAWPSLVIIYDPKLRYQKYMAV